MRLFVSVAAFGLIVAGGALAQTAVAQTTVAQAPVDQTAAPPAASAGKAAKPKDGVICRKEMVTGSQFPVKICTTPEDRQAQRRMAQRAQETMQAPTPVIPN
ncbi:hypothetical protein [uncultured Caulobacter sp.]|uniref:hypothetical protein n=1 Tax=uncultured Caulobacter sp. TaxID=158749 RepID=UPI00261FD51C|nr:hypothetical protein [uncultured Caulobacter sp.]